MFYVYVLRSVSSDNFYIGSTNNLKRRLIEHNGGKSFYSKSYRPWSLIYYEAYKLEETARLREKRLKYNGNARKELMKRILPSKSGAGYTLIEILVALTIVGLLFAFGYVSFRDFARRQAFIGVVRGIKGDLRITQELALSGNKPQDARCNPPNLLSGYNFRVSSTSYAIEAVCAGVGGGTVQVKSVGLTSSGVTIAALAHNPIFFKALGQGTDISSGSPDNGQVVISLTQSVTNSTQTITVKIGGEIE